MSMPARDLDCDGSHAPAGPCRVEVVRNRDDLEAQRGAWEGLVQNAADPNVFYEPFNLCAAVDAFGWEPSFHFVFVTDAAGQAVGFFPLHRKTRFRGTPLRHFVAYEHPHLYLSMPLVDREHGAAAWRTLLDWARRADGALIEIPMVVGESATRRFLREALDAGGGATATVERFNRALLERNVVSADTYITRATSASGRKDWRRQARRLAELGRLELRGLGPAEAADEWIERFLELEAAGWKGEMGTALQNDAAEAGYFRTICQAAHAAGRLHMLGLFLDGRPVAVQCNLFARGGAFALKVAYDETLAKFSPGVLLELESIRDLYGRDDFRWMDSCARSTHPLMHRIWSEERPIERLLIASDWFGQLVLRLFPYLHAAKRSLRAGTPAPTRAAGHSTAVVDDGAFG